MRLTTRSRYGTRMALDIAQNGAERPVRIGDIAERQGVSVKYLEKLVRELKRAGYIKSKRGPKGGHMLARPANEISVGEIVRILEGDEALVECTVNGNSCARMEKCVTRGLWAGAADAMYQKLDSISLADLLEDAVICEKPEQITAASKF